MNKRKLNLRDFLWNYPKFVSDFVRVTNPLSYIIFSFVLSFVLFSFLTSDSVKGLAESKNFNQLVEGTVGSLGSVNPMYITKNKVDRDFYALVYEKFVDVDKNGEIVEGIAVNWEKLSDLEYVFSIQEGLVWHDGMPLTADDIVWNFTTAISLSQDYAQDTYGSSLEGVEIEKVGDFEVKFVLEETNATFAEAVSVYIIPKHVYDEVSLRNFDKTKKILNPIGSGEYMVSSITENGITFVAEGVEITKYRYLFFEDYEKLNVAIKNNQLDIVSNVDIGRIQDLEEYPFFDVNEMVLDNRYKVVYFNTRKDKLKEASLRQAISYLIDIDELIDGASLSGVPARGPLPESSWAFSDTVEQYSYKPEVAQELLSELGYVRGEEYYITESDEKVLSLELKYLANDSNIVLAKKLEELLQQEGIYLQLTPLNYDQLFREVLPTRDFELMLHEVEVTRDPDQYNLWHSLRIDHPHLNISGYNYSRVDILLERARTTLDKQVRKEDYLLFQRYLLNDAPVVFLYHPKEYFLVKNNFQGLSFENAKSPADRFYNVKDWSWD